MRTIAAGLKGLTVADLLGKALRIEEHMTGNPHFPQAGPFVAAMITAREALEHAMVAAADGGVYAHAEQRLRKQQLKDLLVQVQLHVANQAAGDTLKLLSSGFELRKWTYRLGRLPAPQRLVAYLVQRPGEVLLRWAPVHGARVYEVFIQDGSTDDNDGWRSVGEVPRAHLLVTKLASFRRYLFRVRAYGASGFTAFSDPAMGLTM